MVHTLSLRKLIAAAAAAAALGGLGAVAAGTAHSGPASEWGKSAAAPAYLLHG